MPNRRPLLPLAVLVTVLCACEPFAVNESSVLRSDSLGVSITDASRPLVLVSEVLVDSVPRLSIGEMSSRLQDDDSGSVLFGTIVGIVPFPDGRFVVGDRLARELLVFSREGRLLNRFGGNGDGPGELRGISQLHSCGDAAVAVVYRWRVHKFELDTGFSNRFPTIVGNHRLGVRAMMAGCDSLLLSEGEMYPSVGTQGYVQSVFSWGKPPFDIRDTVATVEGLFYRTFAYGGTPLSLLMPFSGSRASQLLVGDRVIVGNGRIAELRIYDLSGGMTGIFRWGVQPALIDGASRDLYQRKRLQFITGSADPSSRDLFPSLSDLDLPATKSVFEGFLADDQGRVWVRRFPRASVGFEDRRPPLAPVEVEEWDIIDLSQGWLGTVSMPNDFRLEAVRSDLLYGVHMDALDVLSVRVYGLSAVSMVRLAEGSKNDTAGR